MRYYVLTLSVIFSLSAGFSSCNADNPVPDAAYPAVPEHPGTDTPDGTDNNKENDNDNHTDAMSNKLKITVGAASFGATLENNATAAAFRLLLPVTITMSEMNGNEKYYYLSGSLPSTASAPETVRTGDLMLYGSSCVVLFYETFPTPYRYSRLGRVDNPAGLAAALGAGSVTVTIELQ